MFIYNSFINYLNVVNKMIKKISIYLCGNAESFEIKEIVKNCLKKKYHSVIEYSNDNYVMNAIKICEEIKKKINSSIGLFFCNDGKNLSFIVNKFYELNLSVITKSNYSQISSFINKNILIFSINNLTAEEVQKSVKQFLLTLQKNVIFY